MKTSKLKPKPADINAFAFDIPAVVSNYLVAHRTPLGVRLTFCEKNSLESDTKLRAAVMLAPADAAALRDLLTNLLGEIDAPTARH